MATQAPDVEIRVGNATAGVNTNKKYLERDSMETIFRRLQASLAKLTTASEKQTAASEQQAPAFASFGFFLNTVDQTVEDEECVEHECDPSLDINNTLDNVLETTRVAVNEKVHTAIY
ncbi:Hypothetical predicted protein [Paramuricea clavata]|uniref:Uncharacterized protein n=1 Tax=Paramuricea clavata TaxID=317549 RepID=A0A6S7JQM1_PARCT|nr:Hypothetical predicted protein [Paramuricea clavata]